MFTIADNLLAAWNTHRAVQEAEKSPDTERSKEEMENNASNGTTDAQLAEGIKHIELAPGSDGVSGLAAPEAWMAAWRAKRSFKDVKESADAIAEAALVDATPALSLRRVTISNLPEWAKVSDVLSLIHGGDIDKVTIDAAGKAVVLFCDAADCKKYYDQYAEGILIAHDDLVITLELGPEENEMTSTHLAAIKAGATRVVALSGVSLEISSQFIAKALQCEFEVDKIVFRADTDKVRDTYLLCLIKSPGRDL